MELTILPDKKLRKMSEEVALPLSKENVELAEAMIKHIKDSKKPGSKLRSGIGIAAVQLGELKRMFYINMVEDAEGNVFEEFLVNPVIVAESASFAALQGGEGCLSVSEDWHRTKGLVHRRFKVQIKGYSYLQGKDVTITKSGYPAIAIQHEYDHLNGKLFLDRIVRGKEWDEKKDEVLI